MFGITTFKNIEFMLVQIQVYAYLCVKQNVKSKYLQRFELNTSE